MSKPISQLNREEFIKEYTKIANKFIVKRKKYLHIDDVLYLALQTGTITLQKYMELK